MSKISSRLLLLLLFTCNQAFSQTDTLIVLPMRASPQDPLNPPELNEIVVRNTSTFTHYYSYSTNNEDFTNGSVLTGSEITSDIDSIFVKLQTDNKRRTFLLYSGKYTFYWKSSDGAWWIKYDD